MKIVIPSYRRPDNVLALDDVSPELQKKYYVLVVRENEHDHYKENYPHPEYWLIPNDTDGIRETRQHINERMSGKIMVIDDDTAFRRTFPKPCLSCKEKGKPQVNWARYTKENTSDVLEDMIEYLEPLMDEYYFGTVRSLSIQARIFEKVTPYSLNKPCFRAVFFNLDHFDSDKYNYMDGPEMLEDIYISVKYFHDGHDIPSVGKFGVEGLAKVGSQKGGCSNPNRSQLHNQSCMELEELYPQYITAIKSETLSRAEHLDNNMLSVRCKFKRHRTMKLF